MGKSNRIPHSLVQQDNPSPNSGLQVWQFGGFDSIPSLNGSKMGVWQEVRSPNSRRLKRSSC